MSLLKIKLSPNYDSIVNFLYENNDDISNLLVDSYQKYILNIKNKSSILSIDNIMNSYILKEDFYKYVQTYFLENKQLLYDDKIMFKLNKLYKTYEEEKLKKVQNTRWL